MEQINYITALYDYYNGLLTDKQKEYFEDYYFENLTQEEIAENNKVSKNAVSKTLIEVKRELEKYENILHLYENKEKIAKILDKKTFASISNYV